MRGRTEGTVVREKEGRNVWFGGKCQAVGRLKCWKKCCKRLRDRRGWILSNELVRCQNELEGTWAEPVASVSESRYRGDI